MTSKLEQLKKKVECYLSVVQSDYESSKDNIHVGNYYAGQVTGYKNVLNIIGELLEPSEMELADRCMPDHNCPTYGVCPECGHEEPEDEHYD